jgi:hypothetical protein
VLDDRLVERRGAPQALLGDAGDELGRRADVVVGVARVDALGRVAQEEVAADLPAGLGEDREHDLLRGAGICRRLQHDQHPRVQMPRHGLGRRHDVGHVGRARLGQRRGYADRQRVEVRDRREVRRGGQSLADRLVALRRHVDQVALSRAHGGDALLAHVDARDREPGLGERHPERQSCVAEADDADPRAAGRHEFAEGA